MVTIEMKHQKTDLHQLELRYSRIRVRNIKRIHRLAASILRHGQLEPLVTVLALSSQTPRVMPWTR